MPHDSIVQPTPYGGTGVSFPSGINFSDLNNSKKVSNKSLPALAACESAGLLWLTTISFLSQFDPKKHEVSGHEFYWPISRPPAGQFVYYFDLQQPVVYPLDYQMFTSSYERWRVERALVDAITIEHSGSSKGTVPIVLPEHWDISFNESGWQYQVLSLAKRLSDDGLNVVLVSESDKASLQPIAGFSTFRFSEFTAITKELSIEWCVATNWSTVHGANTIRRLTDCSVCCFFQFADYRRICNEEPENSRAATWSINGLHTPLSTSRWLLEHLATKNSFLADGLLTQPALNCNLFRSLPIERKSKSTLFVFGPNTSDEDIDFATQCLEEIKARHATVSIDVVLFSDRKSRFSKITDSADSCFSAPGSAELAELFAANEFALFLGTIAGFEPMLVEAAACGAIPIVTDSSTVQTARPDALPAVIADSNAQTLASTIHELLWDAKKNAECKAKLSAWIERLLESPDKSSLPPRLRQSEVKCLRRFSQNNGRSSSLSILIPVGKGLDTDLACLRSVIRNGPKDAKIILIAVGSDASAVRALRAFSENQSSNIKLIEQGNRQTSANPYIEGAKFADMKSDLLLVSPGTVMTRGLVERLQNAAYSRPTIAAATPLSNVADYAQININANESFIRAAQQIAALSEQKRPALPCAEQSMTLIKRWALERFEFFDESFDGHFLEQSDYLARLALNGADTVCADDAFVFCTQPTSENSIKRSRLAKSLIDARWSKFSKALASKFTRDDPLMNLRESYNSLAPTLSIPTEPFSLSKKQKDFLQYSKKTGFLSPGAQVLSDTSVVFLLPGVILGGGSISVIQHANELVQRGIEAKVLSLGQVNVKDYTCLAPIVPVSLEQLFSLDWSDQAVVGTFWTTTYIIESLCKQNSSLKPFYYVQDYEPWFYSHSEEFSRIKEAKQSYELGLRCVAKTEFLSDIVSSEHGVSVDIVSPGLDHSVFYPGSQESHFGRPRLSAMLRLSTSRRGGRETIELLRKLRFRLPELEVTLFGDATGLPSDLDGFAQMKGELSPRDVAQVYRNADIVVDLSYWHGFGRSGIEGMACGAVPVLSASGGIMRYAESGVNSFVVDGEDLDGVADRIIELSVNRELRLDLRQAGLKSVRRFSETLAIDDWIELLDIPHTKRDLDDVFLTRNLQRMFPEPARPLRANS